MAVLSVLILVLANVLIVAFVVIDIRLRPARRALRKARRNLHSIQTTLEEISAEPDERQRILQDAYDALQRLRAKKHFWALPVDELQSKGISKGTIEKLRKFGLKRAGDVSRRMRSVTGIGKQRQLLIDHRLDFLRRRVHDEVDGQPAEDLPTTADETCLRAALSVMAFDPAFVERADTILSRCEPLEQTVEQADELITLTAAAFRPSELKQVSESLVELVESEPWQEVTVATDSLFAEYSKPAAPESHRALLRFFSENRVQIVDFLRSTFQRSRLVGSLAEKVALKVESTEFSPDLKGVRLRPYQVFGAKFVLCQQRVLLGDDMGLGKTMQSIAIASHLARKKGGEIFVLVVCPASLAEQWRREVKKFSHLDVWRLCERSDVGAFLANGGVAIATYDVTWRWVVEEIVGQQKLDLLVADEAHYIKNPEARRSKATKSLLGSAEFALLMTGTPLENKITEMANIIEAIKPGIAKSLRRAASDDIEISPSEFSELISPAYLRRKQADVLWELPDRIEAEEWVEPNLADQLAYRDAVADRHYANMRRAATIGNRRSISAKLERLDELLVAYREADRKILIFSFFLDVLEAVAKRFDIEHSISGRVPVVRRQEIVDSFSESEGYDAMVAQITSAGVGLNIQAASVVVLMEPSFKPTIEWQAIARAHRMGQKEVVYVHRLLAVDTVDERMWERLQKKSAVIGLYSDESRLKDVSPEATKRSDDAEETAFANRVVEQEYTRLISSGAPDREEKTLEDPPRTDGASSRARPVPRERPAVPTLPDAKNEYRHVANEQSSLSSATFAVPSGESVDNISESLADMDGSQHESNTTSTSAEQVVPATATANDPRTTQRPTTRPNEKMERVTPPSTGRSKRKKNGGTSNRGGEDRRFEKIELLKCASCGLKRFEEIARCPEGCVGTYLRVQMDSALDFSREPENGTRAAVVVCTNCDILWDGVGLKCPRCGHKSYRREELVLRP